MERITPKKDINYNWISHILNLHLVTFPPEIGPKMAENWPILPIWRFKLNLQIAQFLTIFGRIFGQFLVEIRPNGGILN